MKCFNSVGAALLMLTNFERPTSLSNSSPETTKYLVNESSVNQLISEGSYEVQNFESHAITRSPVDSVSCANSTNILKVERITLRLKVVCINQLNNFFLKHHIQILLLQNSFCLSFPFFSFLSSSRRWQINKGKIPKQKKLKSDWNSEQVSSRAGRRAGVFHHCSAHKISGSYDGRDTHQWDTEYYNGEHKTLYEIKINRNNPKNTTQSSSGQDAKIFQVFFHFFLLNDDSDQIL